MAPAMQAAGVIGVPAVGIKKGKSGLPKIAPPPQKKAGGDCCGQGNCSRPAGSGSRQPPS